MTPIKIIDLKKTSLNYFVKDSDGSHEKGYVKSAIKVNQLSIEDLTGEEITEIQAHNIILYLAFSHLEDKSDLEDFEPGSELEDDNIFAKLEFTMKVITQNEISDDLTEEELHKNILYLAEPYIHKEVKDFCEEIELPGFSLPYRFWE